jgi:hypothetical protein
VALSDSPLASGQKHRKVFERKFGFECRKNAEHIILVSPAGQVIAVPNHDEVKRPTLKQVLRTCGIDDKEYRKSVRRTLSFRNVGAPEPAIMSGWWETFSTYGRAR